MLTYSAAERGADAEDVDAMHDAGRQQVPAADGHELHEQPGRHRQASRDLHLCARAPRRNLRVVDYAGTHFACYWCTAALLLLYQASRDLHSLRACTSAKPARRGLCRSLYCCVALLCRSLYCCVTAALLLVYTAALLLLYQASRDLHSLRACTRRDVRVVDYAGTQFACFTGTNVLSLLALLVQRYSVYLLEPARRGLYRG
jgi:hypothetical protein